MEYKVTDIIQVFIQWIILILPYLAFIMLGMVIVVKVTKDKAFFTRLIGKFIKNEGDGQ